MLILIKLHTIFFQKKKNTKEVLESLEDVSLIYY